MRRLLIIISALLLAAAPRAAARPLFLPKGDLSAGAQVGFISFNSDNSELLLLLDGMDAKAGYKRFAPFFEFAYADDRSFGFRLDYSILTAAVDNLTLDLLNDGLSFDVSDVAARTRSAGASVFHRNYFGLDDRSRFGFFLEESLSYASGLMQIDAGSGTDAFTSSARVKLSFSPGFEFFVMNNISVGAYISMAGVTYNKVSCHEGDSVTGTRQKFAARFGPDLLGAGFGISFHF